MIPRRSPRMLRRAIRLANSTHGRAETHVPSGFVVPRGNRVSPSVREARTGGRCGDAPRPALRFGLVRKQCVAMQGWPPPIALNAPRRRLLRDRTFRDRAVARPQASTNCSASLGLLTLSELRHAESDFVCRATKRRDIACSASFRQNRRTVSHSRCGSRWRESRRCDRAPLLLF